MVKYIVIDLVGDIIYEPRKEDIAQGLAVRDPKICKQCNIDPLMQFSVFRIDNDGNKEQINPSIEVNFYSLDIHKKEEK